MSKLNMQPYKGSRDFYPEDKRAQKWLFAQWRQVVEKYGYEEYDAPILEPTDLFLMKGSEEIVQDQTYTFQDRGDRSVTIRTEMTPSISRMIAGRRQELAYPVRWYSIPNLWRYERMQKGRLREFWQLNIDMFGIDTIQAELEMILIADDLFQAFKAKRSTYVIKVNSRVLVNNLLQTVCELDEFKSAQLVRLVDKKNKMSDIEFMEAVHVITLNESKTQQIISVLNMSDVAELPKRLQELDSVKNLEKIMSLAKSHGVRNIEFDMTLMRGFDYYTDFVFEAFDTGKENNRSILGGGRYDGLVGQFGVDPLPTVGFAVGDVVFSDFLSTYDLLPTLQPTVEVLVIVREETDLQDVQLLTRRMRDESVRVSADYSGKKVDKQFKNALKSGVHYALFVGPDEVRKEQFVLKDLRSGKEEIHSLERTISLIKDKRKSRSKTSTDVL